MRTAAVVVALIVIGLGYRANAQSTGYPACDKYFSMVSACIKTKMPPEARADQQKQLDAFREILKSPLGATAAGRCEENIRIEIQRDQYGCYGADAAAAGVLTPCSLLTPAQLTSIFHVPFAPGRSANYACEYDVPGAPDRAVRLEVAWRDARDEMQAWRDGVQIVRDQINKSAGQTAPIEAKTIDGVNVDDAFFVTAGFTPMLAVRSGDVALSVRAHNASLTDLKNVMTLAFTHIPLTATTSVK